jgi:hypothetical protein
MLKQNSVLKSLDLSSNLAGDASKSLEFVQELAAGIRDNGALSSLNLASNNMQAAGAKHIVHAISQVYCSDGTRFEETALLWGSKCKHCGYSKADHDKGALIKLDISKNHVGAAQEGELQRSCLTSSIELAK